MQCEEDLAAVGAGQTRSTSGPLSGLLSQDQQPTRPGKGMHLENLVLEALDSVLRSTAEGRTRKY